MPGPDDYSREECEHGIDQAYATETSIVELLRSVPIADGWRTFSEKPDDPMAGSHLHGNLLERAADHIAELKKDRARLDWLGEPEVARISYGWSDLARPNYEGSFEVVIDMDERQSFLADTLREAIDAAMEASNEE